MKELFTNPEIEVISFEPVDIICTSGKGNDFGDLNLPSDRNDNQNVN